MKRPSAHPTLAGLAERGRAASAQVETERADGKMRADDATLKLLTTVVEKPAVKARGSKPIGDDAICLEHGHKVVLCPVTGIWAAANVLQGCGCQFVSVESDGVVARLVIRRDER